MWGTPEERECKLRIDVAAMAYAYEIEQQPLATDAQFDAACLRVNLTQNTGNRKLDKFFRDNFQTHTGMWVHGHPDKEGLRRICALKRRMALMHAPINFDAAALALRVARDLDDHTAKLYDDGHRWHLGASMIGDACSRKLWYSFRWVATPDFVNAKGEDHKGRMLRLFNRGHKEEARFVDWLRGMGFTVEDFAEDGKTQFRIKDVDGHYGGSLDGMVTFPQEYGDIPKMLLEFKTSSDKYFNKLVEEKVQAAKPNHYAQMCSYGARYKLTHALYMAVNKNTDAIHVEIVELDWNYAGYLTEKASHIIHAEKPPERLNENSSYYICKFCDFHAVCHLYKAYEQNCRSCRFARPVENGEWACTHFGTIPRDFVAKGCPSWEAAV